LNGPYPELRSEPIWGRIIAAVDKPPLKVPPSIGSPRKVIVTPVVSRLGAAPPPATEDAMHCERCGAAMYRMHAVWRCPSCRFKSDCCGW
jgi:hypothetical protein